MEGFFALVIISKCLSQCILQGFKHKIISGIKIWVVWGNDVRSEIPISKWCQCSSSHVRACAIMIKKNTFSQQSSVMAMYCWIQLLLLESAVLLAIHQFTLLLVVLQSWSITLGNCLKKMKMEIINHEHVS